ncbi:MAG: response regulator [Proteobacteria bacterium]|nr:response regulator [Pseudomonadota bacterium]
MATDILEGKNILLVDDEPEILDTLAEILDECDIETASTFESAKNLLESKVYDAAVLDIMGVRGFDLLEIATRKKIPALMLTAHGLSPENLSGSIKLGAKSYIPKGKMSDIDIFLKEMFLLQEKGIEKSGNWFVRLSSFFDSHFGRGWKDKDKKFWSEFDRTYQVSKEATYLFP